MSYYTLIRNGQIIGTKELNDAMVERLERHGTKVIPADAPERNSWKPGRMDRRERMTYERATFADVLAAGRRV
jgi:hypothetical protein